MKTTLFISLFFLLSHLQATGFELKSPDISGQLSSKEVYSGFGCQGDNISPQLIWKNAPKETQSFALTVYDPDAPTGSGWWHWVIFNINKKYTKLESNAGNLKSELAPKNSTQSLTDFGTKGFGGACPPKGDKPHRYIFTIYALKTAKIDLPENTNPAKVGFYLNRYTIKKASIMAYYGR